MKELNLQITMKTCTYEELDEAGRSLIDAAKEATHRSYSPYSHFSVGAAVRLTDGTIVTGSNQENAAYPSGLCAERTALFYAGSRYPDQPVEALAIAARNEKGLFTEDPVTPCGACRQVMLETEARSERPLLVLLYGTRRVCLIEGVKSLLPLAFGTEAME
ncbi:MAG: cytidine deaminase [Prevotellaceae bacterium]|nr:cytidine deaminase [Prevotellaceae bacterium]